MKKITLLILFVVSLCTVDAQTIQPYNVFTKANSGKVENLWMAVQTGQPIYYLDLTDGIVTYTYILTDWQGSVGNVPTTFAQGWSLRVTFSPVDKVIQIKLPDVIRKVRDANNNEYVLLE